MKDKHLASDYALERLKKVMYQQDEYGIEKYGTPLYHSSQYNWLAMAVEEVADMVKYLECEMQRKAYVINLLQAGLRADDPRDYVEVALELLSMEGTGK